MAGAAEPLKTVGEVRRLSEEEARKSLPVRVEATVTFFLGSRNDLFVHDGHDGIFVKLPPDFGKTQPPLSVGARLAIEGVSEPGSFLPSIIASRVEVRGHGAPPEPRHPTPNELFSPALDCEWVEVSVVVKTIARSENALVCGVEIEGAAARVSVWLNDSARAPDWFAVERAFRLRGVAATIFNDRRQMTGRQFLVSSFDFMTPEAKLPRVGSVPLRRFDELLRVGGNQQERVRVLGVVTAVLPGAGLYLRGEGGCLYVRAAQPPALNSGDEVEAEGYPELANVAPNLRAVAVRKMGSQPLPQPHPLAAANPLSPRAHQDLVQVDAELIELAAGRERATLVCRSGGRVFDASLDTSTRLPAGLAPGARLRLTGICVMRSDGIQFLDPPQRFTLQLRSPDDIAVLARAPWWTARRIAWLLAGVGGFGALAAVWALLLQRQVSRQTEVIREKIERESVLEERNRIARELHDTLAQGFAGTAFALEGIATNLQAEDHRLRPQIEMALRMVRHSLTEARRSLMNLRADALESRDLATALEETARNLIGSSGVELRSNLRPLAAPLPPNIENDIFRIGVEAVNNALRHANPRTVEVELRSSEGFIIMRVRDDGVGFDPGNVPRDSGHFGVLGMRERARQMNAELEITSSAKTGTEVRLSLPVPLREKTTS